MESEIFGYRFLSWLATCIVEKIRQYSNLETTQFPPVTGRDTLVSSWCNCHIFAALDARYDPTNSDNLHKSTRYLGAANLKKVNWGKLKLPRNCFYSAMATHSSTLAWKIPWMEEPGRLQSLGSLRVGYDWAISLSCIGEGNGNPLQCSCLENPRDRGAWWAAVDGVAQSRTQLKRLSSSSRGMAIGRMHGVASCGLFLEGLGVGFICRQRMQRGKSPARVLAVHSLIWGWGEIVGRCLLVSFKSWINGNKYLIS